MFSHFFIRRPIFAAVLSIVITLGGLVAVVNLPVAQYPRITPPSIIVSCTYPGASARDVAESVAAPIEQEVNGVEGMMYMSSQSANDGSYALTVTFQPGVNLNFAQVLVQNRVNLALPSLPDVVKQTGLTTRKRNPDILLIVSLYSPHGRYGQLYVSNYATIKVADEIKRVDGVGDVSLFGQKDYSMRVWVDPDRLASLNLTAGDVVKAVREQNMQVAAGHFGQQPADPRRPTELTITTLGRLSDPAQFADVVIRTDSEGRQVRIKDVGKVELAPRQMDVTSKVDGQPCTSIAVFQLPYANALGTADRVRAKMEELKKSFPEDLDYTIAYDTTPFIRESIHEVIRTLVVAVILVALVVLIFLQSWRSALIPMAAVPVAIVGTFAVMAAIGFSLNNLTLFGLVLAIGIVVDDAIVVVEAVEHHIEEGMPPHRAAHRAMNEVSAPVVAVALVLSAVFIPCAFISGITGQFFRQFAVTIAVSTILSAFNSLTLSPALAALLLKPRQKGVFDPLPRLAFLLAGGWAAYQFLTPLVGPWLGGLAGSLSGGLGDGLREALPWAAPLACGLAGAVAGWVVGRPLNYLLGRFFQAFNWAFLRTTHGYTRLVGLALRGSALVLVGYGGLILLTWWTSSRLPTGYIPVQDMGKLYVTVQLPDAAALERTQKVVDHIERILHQTPGIGHTIGVAGQSFSLSANGSNFGNLFVTLKDFDQRTDPSMTSDAIAARLRQKFADEIPEAQISVFGPPPVTGLGSVGGFKLIIEDRGDNGLKVLEGQTQRVIGASRGEPDLPARPLPPVAQAARLPNAKPSAGAPDGATEGTPDPYVMNLFTVFRANTPQLYVDLDRDQCQTMGVNPNDVFQTLQIYLGSLYVNDFNRFSRTWQVVVQARGEFRSDPGRIKLLKVRNAGGGMVPLGAVLNVREVGGPILLMRYNMYPAAAIVGGTRPDVSSGQGIDAMEQLCEQTLPPSMAYEWTEINYIQIESGKSVANTMIFPLAVGFVFLVLAAQYESWSLPLAVILVVPMCILGSLTGVAATHTDVNIFTQIGFVVLVGLASKNAILIVEFAKRKVEADRPRREATLEACQLRLRPILMTSFAFILGVVPLLLSTGAGHEMRQKLGTAVFSGMLGVTLFGVFLTPVFFFVIEGFRENPLFSSQRMRKVGLVLRYALDVVTLGLFRLPELVAYIRRSRIPVRPARHAPGRQRKVREDEGKQGVFGSGEALHGNGKSRNGHGAPAEGITVLSYGPFPAPNGPKAPNGDGVVAGEPPEHSHAEHGNGEKEATNGDAAHSGAGRGPGPHKGEV